MKKTKLILLMLMLSLTLTACNSNNEMIIDENVPEGIETFNDLNDNELNDLADPEEKVEVKLTCEDFYKDKLKSINGDFKGELKEETNVFSGANFDVKGNEVIYTYTFSRSYNVDAETLKNQDYDLTINNIKDAIEFESGVRPEKVTLRYQEHNKSLIFEVSK